METENSKGSYSSVPGFDFAIFACVILGKKCNFAMGTREACARKSRCYAISLFFFTIYHFTNFRTKLQIYLFFCYYLRVTYLELTFNQCPLLSFLYAAVSTKIVPQKRTRQCRLVLWVERVWC